MEGRQARHRTVKAIEQGNEGDDSSKAHLAADCQVAAVEVNQCWTSRLEHLQHHSQPAPQHIGADLNVHQLPVFVEEANPFEQLLHKGLHKQIAADVECFLHDAAELCLTPLRLMLEQEA